MSFTEYNHIDAAMEETLIPMVRNGCTKVICQALCEALGFKHGVCNSADLCQCSK